MLSAKTSICTEEGEREASRWAGLESLEEELGRWCRGTHKEPSSGPWAEKSLQRRVGAEGGNSSK